MLPAVNPLLTQDIEFVEVPTHTFYLDKDNKVCHGCTDSLRAMEQAIYLVLRTERYKYAIFSWNYGIELEDLFGMPISWVIPEAKRRIQEALLNDTRIKSVDNFGFSAGKGELLASFTAHTIFGDLPIETGVNF
jgi:hypothetical protein